MRHRAFARATWVVLEAFHNLVSSPACFAPICRAPRVTHRRAHAGKHQRVCHICRSCHYRPAQLAVIWVQSCRQIIVISFWRVQLAASRQLLVTHLHQEELFEDSLGGFQDDQHAVLAAAARLWRAFEDERTIFSTQRLYFVASAEKVARGSNPLRAWYKLLIAWLQVNALKCLKPWTFQWIVWLSKMPIRINKSSKRDASRLLCCTEVIRPRTAFAWAFLVCIRCVVKGKLRANDDWEAAAHNRSRDCTHPQARFGCGQRSCGVSIKFCSIQVITKPQTIRPKRVTRPRCRWWWQTIQESLDWTLLISSFAAAVERVR